MATKNKIVAEKDLQTIGTNIGVYCEYFVIKYQMKKWICKVFEWVK